jgi:uncharacterized membrane protein
MNTVFALIAVVGGMLASLVAYKVVPLEKFVNPGDAENWYDKFGKITKIIAPAAAVVGLVLLLF